MTSARLDADVIRTALLRSERPIQPTDEEEAAWMEAPAALDRLEARLHSLERGLERDKRAHDVESDMLAADRNAERRRAEAGEARVHSLERALEQTQEFIEA